MKKQIIAALLIGCSVFGFAGCGSQPTQPGQLIKNVDGQYVLPNSELGEKYILTYDDGNHREFKVIITDLTYNNIDDFKKLNDFELTAKCRVVADCIEYNGELYYNNYFTFLAHEGHQTVISKDYPHDIITVEGDYDKFALVKCVKVERDQNGKLLHETYKVVKDFTQELDK